MTRRIFVVLAGAALLLLANTGAFANECTSTLSAHIRGLELGLKTSNNSQKSEHVRKELELIKKQRTKIPDCDIQSALPSYKENQRALEAAKRAVEKMTQKPSRD